MLTIDMTFDITNENARLIKKTVLSDNISNGSDFVILSIKVLFSSVNECNYMSFLPKISLVVDICCRNKVK